MCSRGPRAAHSRVGAAVGRMPAMKHGQHASNEAWVARVEILGSMPAMKRARARLLSELLADTAEPDVVWQVCLQEAWRGKGPAADGVDAFS